MAPVVADMDQLSTAISHATAPAFMLGAVAGFLSILIARLERIGDRRRALRSNDGTLDPSLSTVEASYSRRMLLLSRAIFFAAQCFGDGEPLDRRGHRRAFGVGRARVVATLFTIALALLMAALVELTREIRVYMSGLNLD
jgi:hypothetical protein